MAFVVLSTGNGTALTLSGGHIIYVADAASGARKPAPARDVKVRRRGVYRARGRLTDLRPRRSVIICVCVSGRDRHLRTRSLLSAAAKAFMMACLLPQVGDSVWSMLPGAQRLAATHITNVDHVIQAGYINVHTLQGEAVPRPMPCCASPRWQPQRQGPFKLDILTLSHASNGSLCDAGNAIVDGIAASNFIVQEDQGLVLDAMTSERIKYSVRTACPCVCLALSPS